MEAMHEYVSESTECRQRYLLRYFGQDSSEDCGQCDVCRARAASGGPAAPPEGGEGSSGSAGDVPGSNGDASTGIRRKAPGTMAQFTRRKLQEFIDEREGRYTLASLMEEFGNPSRMYSPDYLSILRTMIDDGTVPMYEG
jgi:hypothetical protein